VLHQRLLLQRPAGLDEVPGAGEVVRQCVADPRSKAIQQPGCGNVVFRVGLPEACQRKEHVALEHEPFFVREHQRCRGRGDGLRLKRLGAEERNCREL